VYPYYSFDYLVYFNRNFSNYYWTDELSAFIEIPIIKENVEAIKIKINYIADTETKDDDHNEGVKIDYSLYESENRDIDIWNKKKDYRDFIYKYGIKAYQEVFEEKWMYHTFYNVKFYSEWGYSFISPEVKFELYPDGRDFMYFIDKNTNLSLLRDELRDHYDAYERREIKYSKLENELIILIDENQNDGYLSAREYIYRYSDDGLLLYYEWLYNGKTIIKLELEWQFFVLFPWIIIGGIAFLAISIIVGIIFKNQANKKLF